MKFSLMNLFTLCAVAMCAITDSERASLDKFGTAVAEAAAARVVKEIEGTPVKAQK